MHVPNSAVIMRFHRFLLGETSRRLEMYQRAIQEKVKPGDTVCDVGTGTGILAFMACRAGARRVYAVETGSVLEVARLLSRENGFEDRIVFLDGLSDDIDLGEPVDALVTDTFSPCGLQSGGLRSMISLRDRFLKTGGALIPTQIEFFVAPVELPQVYQGDIDFWDRTLHGVDFSAVRRLAVNDRYPVHVQEQAVLAEPVLVTRADLCQLESVFLQGEASVTIRKSGTLHGLCGWFSTTLADGVVLSNRPGATTTNYAQGFFPIARPVALSEDDRVAVCIQSYDGLHWRWQVDIYGPDAPLEPAARFDHSTFWGFPVSRSLVQKLASDYAPKLSRRGEAEHALLLFSDGKTPVAELQRLMLQRFPDVFKSQEEAFEFVSEVMVRCT
jgi:type I protein arginine methyltransferase